VRVLVAVNPGNIPRLAELGSIALDPRVILFTLLLTALTGALFGLVPALAASRVDLSGTLNESRGLAARQSSARAFLVIAETALALVLLVGSGLLIRTFMAMHSVDRGFTAENVLTIEMSVGTPRYEKTAAVAQLIHEAEERVERLPGVLSMASTISVPLEPSISLPYIIARRPLLGSPFHGVANWRSVSRHYFEAFRIRLDRGRLFTIEDERGAARVCVINEAMARQQWPGGKPLGEVLVLSPGGRSESADLPREIVGIVADVRESGLNRPAEPIIYVPAAQVPDAMNAALERNRPLTFVARTVGDPWRLSAVIQRELLAASSGLPFARIRSMEEVVAESTARTRFTMTLLGAFAVIALLMAAVGIYGLVSYSVEQRTREIGIRVAIGATPNNVRNLVLGEGMRLALLGVSAGGIAALALTKVLDSLIYGVQSWDPLVFVSAGALLCVVAAAAAYVPALRATRVDPLTALRQD
jgi:predicted permease